MKIYLDIDSILLVDGRTLANHVDTFLQAILKKYPDATYWLTPNSNTSSGETKRLLSVQLKPETVSQLDKIKIVEWRDTASQAVDFKHDFLWFGNELWPEDLKTLEQHEVVERFILVDLAKHPDILQELAQVVTNFTD